MDELATLRQQALRSIARPSKKVHSKAKHKEDQIENQIETAFGIDEQLVEKGSKKQRGSSQQGTGLEPQHTESGQEFRHGERRNRRPTEKDTLMNHSLSRSGSTFSSSSRSLSYTSSRSNSPSGSTSGSSSYTPTHSSLSSRSNGSTHAEILESEKYPDSLITSTSTHQTKLVDHFPSSSCHAQSDRDTRSFGGSSGHDQRKSREGGEYHYEERKERPSELHEKKRDPVRESVRLRSNDERRTETPRLQSSDERRREPPRLQSNDERRREPPRLQPNDEWRREPQRLHSNDERRREPPRNDERRRELPRNDERRRELSRLQSNDDWRREPPRLQSNDERRREPPRLQSNDEWRREPPRLQPNDERRRELSNGDRRRGPLRLQLNDEQKREPLKLQLNERRREEVRLRPNDDRSRETLRAVLADGRRREPLRLQSNDDRRREPLTFQPRNDRREVPSRTRKEPSRLQSGAAPQYGSGRHVRSPVRTGIDGSYKRVGSTHEENSDTKGDDSYHRRSHSNRSPVHLPSSLGSPSSQQRALYSKQDQREAASHEPQSRKRRASPDEQAVDFAHKRMHVEQKQENVYKSTCPKEGKRGSSTDSTRRHLQASNATSHHEAAFPPEEELLEFNHRGESQGHTREYSEPIKLECEQWSKPARDHLVTEKKTNDTQVKEIEEELDYDENMDDIDIHVYRPDDLDIQEKDKEEKNAEQSVSAVPEPTGVSVSHDEVETFTEVVIRSPIRVSPERKQFKSRDSERLPVKERLYLSKSAIQRKKEERLVHYHEDPKPQLRPSLASRLGPAPRRSRHEESSSDPDRKESRTATTDEYRKRKQEVEVRQEDIERARRITKSLNKHEIKETRTCQTEDKNAKPQEKEKTLDDVIDKIKEKNKSIVKRKKEIEMDVEQYGQ